MKLNVIPQLVKNPHQKIHLMQKDTNVAVRQVKINVILNSYNIEENKEF
jgi:hypothetical protein